MMDTIEKLWNGGITPSVTCTLNDDNIKELTDLIQRNKNDISHELNENQKEMLETLSS